MVWSVFRFAVPIFVSLNVAWVPVGQGFVPPGQLMGSKTFQTTQLFNSRDDSMNSSNSTTAGLAGSSPSVRSDTEDILEFLDSVAHQKPPLPEVLSAAPPAHGSERARLRTLDSKGDENPLLKTNFINNEGTSAIPYSNIGSKPGIGGDGGLVYDVNRLKRNLLQETMSQYKKDLLELLSKNRSTEAQIAEKLAALVQASPVRTTTDSNFLDGKWGFCYMSRFTSPLDLQSISNSRTRKSERAQDTPASRRRGGKESFWRTHQRAFYLEDLDDDENAHILDHVFYLGGIYTKTVRSNVEGLSRTNLRARPASKTYTLAGIRLKKEKEHADGKNYQFLYSDVDLCIVADAAKEIFSVYTKAPQWVSTAPRRRRKWKFAISYFPTKLRGVIPKPMAPSTDTSEVLKLSKSPLLREVYSTDSRLRVLKLGGTGGEDEDDTWESSNDPFVHLSADERQKVLRNMKVGDIQRAERNHRGRRRRTGWMSNLFRRRKTYFRGPPGE